MRNLSIATTLALLALATPVTADAEAEAATPVDCGWCCFLGQIDYAQCMGTMIYENNEPAGPAGQITGAYWDATMYSVDVVQAIKIAQSSALAACGWCCGLGTIDYAQCMGEEAYPDVNGPAGQIVGAYWDATMYSIDVAQDNLPAANAAAVKYGCDGRTVMDDVHCFAYGVDDPILYCYGTAVVECIVTGELNNWRTFNQRVCDHHVCLHFP